MKLIILDRDGVINQDSDAYIKSPEEWIPIPGSLKAIAALKSSGYTVAVATNQSGISRGLFTNNTLTSIHQLMYCCLKEYNTTIDYLAWCPHGPDDGCECRKPKPGLYHEISSFFNCCLENVPIVGDSKRDLDAASLVGAQPILLKSGKGEKTFADGQLPANTLFYDDLLDAVTALLRLS